MRFQHLATSLIVLLLTHSAFAVKISDITRIGGERTNVLTGMGLVVGLKGTGDGKNCGPTTRMVAQLVRQLSGAVSSAEQLDASNVAMVTVLATLPATGTRVGDHLDVELMSMGNATSLTGGDLYIVALMGPNGKPYRTLDATGHPTERPFGLANGTVETTGSNPNKGIVRGGAVMEVDLPPRSIDQAERLTLVINTSSASWSTANAVVRLINQSSENGETIATAIDERTVVVQIPVAEQDQPASFLAQLLDLQLPGPAIAAVIQPAIPQVIQPATPPVIPPVQTAAAAAIAPSADWWPAGLVLIFSALYIRKIFKSGATSNPKRGSMRFANLVPAVVVMLLTQSAFAVKIADITRMSGARTNVLTGMGLVMGLKGTGDGGKYLPAMRPLAALMKNFDQPVSLSELGDANNVAIVSVFATLPASGVRNGDALDVQVVSMGAATSLKNGVLFMVSMNGPGGKMFKTFDGQGKTKLMPFAIAKGDLEPDENNNPLKGVIRGGAVMEVDLPPRYVDDAGRFTLVIDQPSASWAMASTIAKMVNESSDSGDNIAVALDPKNVLVQIPASERDRPDTFIARVLALPVPIQTSAEARVLIDDKSGTMIVTGDVEISPVVISHKGLTITTINPPPVASVRNPLVSTKLSIPLDTTNQGGARLQDLANAFDQLKVPAEDRIVIIKDLYKTGKLHAKLLINGQEG